MIVFFWLALASMTHAQERVSIDESPWFRETKLPEFEVPAPEPTLSPEQEREEFEFRYRQWSLGSTQDKEPIEPLVERSKLWDIGQRFKRNIRSRMFGELEFAGVDIEDPTSLDRLDSFSRNEFDTFMERRAGRASEWYLSNLLDPQAEEVRDLLPDSWRRIDWFQVTGIRFGRSQRISNAEIKTGAPVAPADGSTLDQSIDSKWYIPFVDATSSLDLSQLGEFRLAGRIRLNHIGGGLGWRPWPESFPVQFRFDYDLSHDDGRERWETSANLDLFRLIHNGDHAGKRQLMVYVRYDSETEDGWAGLMFSH